MGTGRVAAIAVATALLASSLLASAGAHAAGGPSGEGNADVRSLSTDVVPVPAGTPTHALPSGQLFRVGLTLAYSHPDELATFLREVQDPASPQYRQFLTYSAFEARFGPSSSAVGAAEDALRAAGASSVDVRGGSTTVEALLPGSGIAQLLGVTPVGFTAPDGLASYTSVGTLRLPASLEGIVDGVEGLSGAAGAPAFASIAQVTPLPAAGSAQFHQFVQGGLGGPEWFLGSDFTQAYEATALLPGNASSVPSATFPYHVSIATLLASAYSLSSSTDLPPFDPTVVDRYFTDTLAPGWPMPNLTGVPVPEAGAPTPPLPGPFGSRSDSIGLETENSLDLEMAGSLAPGAPLYNFYFSGSLVANPTFYGNTAGYLADDLAAALNYTGYGSAPLGIVSCSFGLPDLNDSAWNSELDAAAAMGVTVVAASGDQGNAPNVATGRADGPNPLWPAEVAFNTSGVLSVGGVSPTLSGNATAVYVLPPLVARYDSQVQGLATTSAWYDTTNGFGSYSGTEGGVSVNYTEPYWQFHSAAQPPIVSAAEVQGVATLGRAGPDLAFPANDTIAYISATAGGQPNFGLVSGTSIAAPVLAGLLADVVAVETVQKGSFSPLGFIDPEIYRLAGYFEAFPDVRADPFVDTVNGSNAVFSATVGWDATTGWGGLFAPLFLQADENEAERNFSYTGPTPTLPPHAPPGISFLTGVLIVIGAGTAAVVAVVVVLSGRHPETPAPDIFDPYVQPPAFGTPGTGPVAPPAMFDCPYCGRPRPAEAGPCPSCGVS